MIDTENVGCDTCTAPALPCWTLHAAIARMAPRRHRDQPLQGAVPAAGGQAQIAFLDSAATAQRPACVLAAQKSSTRP